MASIIPTMSGVLQWLQVSQRACLRLCVCVHVFVCSVL